MYVKSLTIYQEWILQKYCKWQNKGECVCYAAFRYAAARKNSNKFNFVESLPHSVKKILAFSIHSFVEIWHFSRLDIVFLLLARHSI